MPSDRKFHSDEQARREAYDHSASKDINFNPTFGLEKAGRYDQSLGKSKLQDASRQGTTRGPDYKQGGREAIDISDAVPRRGE